MRQMLKQAVTMDFEWKNWLGKIHEVPNFVLILSIILFAFLLSRLLNYLLTSLFGVLNSGKTPKIDPTQFRFFRNGLGWGIAFLSVIAIIYTVPPLRSLAVTFFAGAGILAAVIGFASQQAFSNIIGGIFIVIFRPFRVDDIIQVGEKFRGKVEDITLRHTVICDFENRRIIIPNSKISSETITNDTIWDEKICRHYEVFIAYNANLEEALRILQQTAEKHPNCIDNRSPQEIDAGIPKVVVRVVGFSDSAIKLRANVWSKNSGDSFRLSCDLNKEIKTLFEAAQIGFPYPHRTVLMKN